MTTFSSPLPVLTYRTDAFDGLGVGRQHMGTDYAGPFVGSMTDTYAFADGTVTLATGAAGALPGHSGSIVVIDHGNIPGIGRVRSNHGHLSEISVRVGQKVKAGQKIGRTGRTGNVTGVHLHFGIRVNGTGFTAYVDPDELLRARGITVGKTKPVAPGIAITVASVVKKAADAGVLKYQRAQRYYPNMAIDGFNGTRNKAHKKWVKGLATKTQAWKGTKLRKVTDSYDTALFKRVAEIQTRNHHSKGGGYKGVIDGIAGPIFCKFIGYKAHPYA